MSALPDHEITPTLEFETPTVVGIWSLRIGPTAAERAIAAFDPVVEVYQSRWMTRLRWALTDNEVALYREDLDFRDHVHLQAACQKAHVVEVGDGWGDLYRRINLIYGALPGARQRFQEWARRTR